jgi:tetratricopeptide (TPR) repeat protein
MGTTADLQLERFLEYLEHDRDNQFLLIDATNAAIEAHKPEIALQLLGQLEKLTAPTPTTLHLHGLAALQNGDFHGAEAIFSGLIAAGHNNPTLRFNVAWSKAVLADHAGALQYLDDAALAVTDRAPALKVRMLHHLGRLDEALAVGDKLLVTYPANGELAGALSAVAMDTGDMARAATYATQGDGNADALSTLGLIALSRYEQESAMALFDRALDAPADQPRAWLGRGLARLSSGDAKGASHDLERAATLFRGHIGSWIAAGWAYFAAGNQVAARRCFDSALALDANFAESHGSLAVLDVAAGKFDQARRGTAVAIRLNRQCFSGALAKSLLAEHDNNPLLAQKIRERAMNVAIGADGQTIAQALVAVGLSSGGASGAS